jgi:hypothetical protein
MIPLDDADVEILLKNVQNKQRDLNNEYLERIFDRVTK